MTVTASFNKAELCAFIVEAMEARGFKNISHQDIVFYVDRDAVSGFGINNLKFDFSAYTKN